MSKIREIDPETPLPVVGHFEGWMDRGVTLGVIIAVALGLLAGVLALVFGIMLSRYQRARVASEWRLATALLLVQALRTAPDGKVPPEAVDHPFDRLKEAEGPDSIAHALRDRLESPPPERRRRDEAHTERH